MWPFKSKVSKLQDQLLEVMDERDNYREDLIKLKLRRDNYKEIIADVYESSFSFDWKLGRAFSIERIHDWCSDQEKYLPVTVIGYIKEEKAIGEWRFYCSAEEHERLVKEFNETRKKQK